jgi:hypothetical protein
MVPACTENRELADPAETVVEAGTLNGARLASWIDTVDPPLGAGADRVTWHVAEADDASVLGLQIRLVTTGTGGGGGANCKEKL